ncbi:MAG: glycoside hydrolase family 2 TIM barrel-domain containing protein [Bacteroidota bacterium]
MRKYSLCLLLIVSCLIHAKAQKPSLKTTDFNQNWQFVKDIDTTNSGWLLSAIKTPNISWEKVSLPHTPRIEPIQKVEEQWQGTCFYRKFFTIAAADKGKHIALQFDAAMNDADVYLNGKHIYKHVGGYLPFYLNVSEQVKYGQQNCVLVKLNNRDNPVIPPAKPIKDLDFNFYGGIYRNTWLIIKNKVYINNAVQAGHTAGGGVLVHNELLDDHTAKLLVKTEVNNDFAQQKKVRVKVTLMDKMGKIVATSTSAEQAVSANGFNSISQTLTVNDPKLWSPTHPNLYKMQVQVLQNGQAVDEQRLKTGIKTIKFDAKGFYLNGQRLEIVGTNRHQEYPYIGYALSDNAQYRDAWKIKDAGFNFVRCSHYPPSPAFFDACDELGILVMDAIPGWQFFGNKEFQDNSLQNIKDMMRRDRNHAAIILWEASLNETGMSKPYMDTANAIAHREMPFKDVYTTGWIDYAYDVFNPARQHKKAPDYWKKYNKDKPLLIAEYGDWEYYAQNAGFNQKEYANLKSEERNSRQVRGDGQQRLAQQALNFQEAHNDDKNNPGIGDVNWLMFDYKRGYATDLESSGVMDIFRLPKFSFYFYQSQYGPVVDDAGFGKPMLHIANYWNDAKQKDVKIYSNCEQVELFINGQSAGRQNPDTSADAKNLKHPPFTFHPDSYTPGKLTAIGYIGGKKVVTDEVSTPGDAYKIVLKADLSGRGLAPGKNDHVFVYAYITDKDGHTIPTANQKVKFTVAGAGVLTGASELKAEAGIATALLKGGNQAGKITVKASADGLASGTWVYTLK